MSDKPEPEIFPGNAEFPFGELRPPDGFKVGDYVGLIYSDHGEYIFDNPTGVVTAVEGEPDGNQQIEVAVSAEISSGRVFLMARPKPGQTIAPDGTTREVDDLEGALENSEAKVHAYRRVLDFALRRLRACAGADFTADYIFIDRELRAVGELGGWPNGIGPLADRRDD